MSRVRIILLIASVLWLSGCADPDPDQAPARSPVANNFFLLQPKEGYEATHPDGPYHPTDPFDSVPDAFSSDPYSRVSEPSLPFPPP